MMKYEYAYEGTKEIRFICQFRSISWLLDLDPHSQLTDPGSGSRRANSMRIRIHATEEVLFYIHLADWSRIYLASLDPDLDS